MRLSKGVPLDPCAGLSPEARAWVDRCKLHYVKRLAFGGGTAEISGPALQKMLYGMGRNERRANAKALKYFEECLDTAPDPDTAKAAFEAAKAALTSKAPRGGRPTGKKSEAVLFLWSKLKADGLLCVSEAVRVIAHVLRYYGDGSPTEGTIRETIRNFEEARRR